MGAQEALPDAIGKRCKVINLSEGGTFTVTRWALAKTIKMATWVAGQIKDISVFDAESLKATTTKDFMGVTLKFMEALGDKIPQFLELAVDPVDAATLREIPADDALEVLEAVIELNITDKFLGKVKGLIGAFRSKFKANAKNT